MPPHTKNNPQLIAMHVPMLGAADGAAISRNRHLKHTAIMVVDTPALMRGMFVLTFP